MSQVKMPHQPSKRSLETALLKQLPPSFSTVQIQSLEDVKNLRLQVAERVAEQKMTILERRQNYCGLESQLGALALIHMKYMGLTSKQAGASLKCPCCGDPDLGNKRNKKAWCFKCNVALEAASSRKKVVKVKALPKKLGLGITFINSDGGKP